MTWREEAKELGIKLFHRTKAEVVKDIEATKGPTLAEVEKCHREMVADAALYENLRRIGKTGKARLLVDRDTVTKICTDALMAHVIEQGLCGEISCVKWFINCQRKGIVFTGRIKDEDRQRETDGGQESTECESVLEECG